MKCGERVFGGMKGKVWKGGETSNAVWFSEGGTGEQIEGSAGRDE